MFVVGASPVPAAEIDGAEEPSEGVLKAGKCGRRDSYVFELDGRNRVDPTQNAVWETGQSKVSWRQWRMSTRWSGSEVSAGFRGTTKRRYQKWT
jgi:hypothetical protein